MIKKFRISNESNKINSFCLYKTIYFEIILIKFLKFTKLLILTNTQKINVMEVTQFQQQNIPQNPKLMDNNRSYSGSEDATDETTRSDGSLDILEFK